MSATVNTADAINRNASLNHGLVAWWATLPGQQRGNVYRDLCRKNHGAITGGALCYGPRGRRGGFGSVFLNGTNGYVNVPNSADFTLTNITVTAWVYNTTDVSTIYVAKRDNPNYAWELGRNATGDALLWRINDNANVATGGSIPLNTWTWVGGTYNAATIAAYVNGAQVNTASYAVAINNNSVAVTIGRRAFVGAEGYHAGMIDDVRIYNRALSATAMYQLYRASLNEYRNELDYVSRRSGQATQLEQGGTTFMSRKHSLMNGRSALLGGRDNSLIGR